MTMGTETGTSLYATYALVDRIDVMRKRIRDIRGVTPTKLEVLEMALELLEKAKDSDLGESA
jgi:hypothetical protein